MKYYLLLLIATMLVAMAFSYKEKPVRFNYCRVEVEYPTRGMVIDSYGTIVFREDAIIMRSNNKESDAIFVIEKEVAPELDNHKAWLTYNTTDKEVPIIIELGEGDGVKLTIPNSEFKSFFFSVDREKELEPLDERNVWYEYPRGGGELKKRTD